MLPTTTIEDKKIHNNLIVWKDERKYDFDEVYVCGNVNVDGESVTSVYIDGKCITQIDSDGFYEFRYPRRSTTLVFKPPGYKDVKVKINRKTTYTNIDVFPPKL